MTDTPTHNHTPPPTTDPWAEAYEAAGQANVDAALDGADQETKVRRIVDAAITALAHHGLATPAPTTTGRDFTVDDIAETARWLASMSGFVRYTGDTDGWRRVLSSPADVETAFTKASARPGRTDGDRRHLAAARQFLLDHVDRARLAGLHLTPVAPPPLAMGAPAAGEPTTTTP